LGKAGAEAPGRCPPNTEIRPIGPADPGIDRPPSRRSPEARRARESPARFCFSLTSVQGESYNVFAEELLRQSDFVSMHTPLGKGTYHLMGEAQFRLMKPSALFVNTSRGVTPRSPLI